MISRQSSSSLIKTALMFIIGLTGLTAGCATVHEVNPALQRARPGFNVRGRPDVTGR
jgi:hypothetical protein